MDQHFIHLNEPTLQLPRAWRIAINCIVALVLWSVCVLIFFPILRHWIS